MLSRTLLAVAFWQYAVDGVRLKKHVHGKLANRLHAQTNGTVPWVQSAASEGYAAHSWLIDTHEAIKPNPMFRDEILGLGKKFCLDGLFTLADRAIQKRAAWKALLDEDRGIKVLGAGGFKHVILVRKYSGEKDWSGKLGALNLFSTEMASNSSFVEMLKLGLPTDQNQGKDKDQDQQIVSSSLSEGELEKQQFQMSIDLMNLFRGKPLVMQLEDDAPHFGVSDAKKPALDNAHAFVTEFAQYGDLANWLQGMQPDSQKHATDKGQVQSDITVKCFDYLAQRLFSAVATLHEGVDGPDGKKKFQHCDLKPENFLIRNFEHIGGGVMCPEVFLSDLDTAVDLDKEICDVGTPSYWPFGYTNKGLIMRADSTDPSLKRFNEYWSIGAILVEAMFPIRYLRVRAGAHKGKVFYNTDWRLRGETFTRRFGPQELLGKLRVNDLKGEKKGGSWPDSKKNGPWEALGTVYGVRDATSKKDLMAVPHFSKKLELVEQLLNLGSAEGGPDNIADKGTGDTLLAIQQSVDSIVKDTGLVQARLALVQQIVEGQVKTNV